MSDVGGGSVATVTVLVCDLVSSTAQRTSLGDDLADGLAVTLDYYLRQSVLEHRGHVLKSTGDGLLATFDAASDALAAAVVAQQRIERRNRNLPALEHLVIRAGVSAGDVQFIARRRSRDPGRRSGTPRERGRARLDRRQRACPLSRR